VLVSGQRGLDPQAIFSARGFGLQQLGGTAWWREYSRGDVAVEDALGDALCRSS